MLAELALAVLLDTFTCADIPAHPQEPTTEALLMNGLAEQTFDLEETDSGRPIVLTEWYRILDVDLSREEEPYHLEPHPLITIVARAGYADLVWVDREGHGRCSEMARR
jgi:hypothetical protein